jgi:hypothetical protein
MTWNVNTEELISQNLKALGKPTPLDFKELDIITGTSLSIAKNLHGFIVEL